MILFERRSGCKCVSLHQQPQCYTLWASLAFQAIQSLFLLQARRKGWWGFVKNFFWSHSGAAPQSGTLSKTAVSRMNFNLLDAYNIAPKIKHKNERKNIALIHFFYESRKSRCTAECVYAESGLKSFRNSQLLFDVDRIRCRNTAVTHLQMSPARYSWHCSLLKHAFIFEVIFNVDQWDWIYYRDALWLGLWELLKNFSSQVCTNISVWVEDSTHSPSDTSSWALASMLPATVRAWQM